MSAALALSALAAVGGELRADGRRLRLLARGPLPAELRAAVRAAAPALLRVASDQWRTEMAAWPVSWVDLWNECAGPRPTSDLTRSPCCPDLDLAPTPVLPQPLAPCPGQPRGGPDRKQTQSGPGPD